jgi:cell wall-associated NlpC family hydrolase
MSDEATTFRESITRAEIVAAARSLLGARYAAQGRLREIGFDCAGAMIKVGHITGITAFDILGYASEPSRVPGAHNGKIIFADEPDGRTFERLLDESPLLIKLPSFWDAQIADVLACDFGEGVQHVAIVAEILPKRFDWRRFTVIHATRKHGLNESPLPTEYYRALKSAYKIKAVID